MLHSVPQKHALYIIQLVCTITPYHESQAPTAAPTEAPTAAPTKSPAVSPTATPTKASSRHDTTSKCTIMTLLGRPRDTLPFSEWPAAWSICMLCCFAGIDHVNNCIWYLVILALVLPPLRLLHICCPHPVLCVLLVQLMSGAVFCSSCSAPRSADVRRSALFAVEDLRSYRNQNSIEKLCANLTLLSVRCRPRRQPPPIPQRCFRLAQPQFLHFCRAELPDSENL